MLEAGMRYNFLIIYDCVRKELSLLIETVKEIDPHAFIIVNNVHEVLGQGFRPGL